MDGFMKMAFTKDITLTEYIHLICTVFEVMLVQFIQNWIVFTLSQNCIEI